MPDTTPVPSDRTVIVQRHSALTYISLAFNALILLLILISIVAHHGRKPPGKPDDGGPMGRPGWADRDGNRDEGFRDGGWRHHHMREGGMGNDRGGDSCSGACEMGGRGDEHHESGMDEEHPGWGDDHHGMDDDKRGWGGHPGFGMDGQRGWGEDHRGPGMGGGFGEGGDHSMSGTPPSAEEMTDRLMLMLTPKLKLTDAEAAQIRPVITGDIQQFQKELETQKQEHQKMIEDGKTKIRAVLTPDQQKQFDAMTAEMGGTPPATK